MIELLNQYLVQHRELVFSDIGQLQIFHSSTRFDPSRQVLTPPRISFQWNPFSDESFSIQPILGFVSKQTQMSEEECFDMYTAWCAGIRKILEENGEWPWPGIGKLVMLAGGKTGFVPDAQLEAYSVGIEASRASKTGKAHHMVVGDKETNTTAMQQQLLEEDVVEVKEGNWWIAAVIIGSAGLGLILARFAGWF